MNNNIFQTPRTKEKIILLMIFPIVAANVNIYIFLLGNINMD